VPLHYVLHLEEWNTHTYAKCFGLIGACDDAAIVSRKHNDWSPIEIGAKYAFTRHKKVIAIGKSKHHYAFLMM
jgi:hypothetical protein